MMENYLHYSQRDAETTLRLYHFFAEMFPPVEEDDDVNPEWEDDDDDVF